MVIINFRVSESRISKKIRIAKKEIPNNSLPSNCCLYEEYFSVPVGKQPADSKRIPVPEHGYSHEL